MPRMVASGAHLARIADFTRAYRSRRNNGPAAGPAARRGRPL